VYLLLVIHHTFMWNRVFQNSWIWLFQVFLWGLLRGRWHRGMLCVHGFFHPFEFRNLGEMVCIMSIITIKSARVFIPNIVVVLPLSFVIIVPLGVLVSLILVPPSRMVLLGAISSWSWVTIVSIFSFILGIIRVMGQIFRIQLFKILNLLNGRGLNKINVGMWVSLWRSNRLWRTEKWKVVLFWGFMPYGI
jgi:hypothetical protein